MLTRRPLIGPSLLFAGALAACGGGSGEDPEGGEASESGASTTEETGEAGESGGALVDVALPQALGDAMYVNTVVYAEIPVHVRVEGEAESVQVSVGGVSYDAVDPEADGDWVATVAVAGTGSDTLTATASAGETSLEATAELVRGDDDIQLTDEDTVGPSTTPHPFVSEGRLFVVYTDRVDGSRVLLQELDGAGRTLGDPIVLVAGSVGATNARIEVADGQIAMVYQTPTGTPYEAFFAIYDLEGDELLAPMPLQTAGWSDSFGGDLEWDGEAFQVVHRINDGMQSSALQWLSITPSGDVTGPVDLATATPTGGTSSEPEASFPPATFVDLAVVGDHSVVTWSRYRYLGLLDTEVLKGYAAVVSREGEIVAEDAFASADDFLWTHSFHVNRVGERAVAIANVDDLNSPDVPAPTAFRGFAFDAGALENLSLDAGTLVLQEPDLREEVFVVEHPVHGATMLWIDHRQKSATGPEAPIELRVAALSESLELGDELVFPQARFFAGLAQLRGAPISTNLAISWSDARRGFPSSETYLDFVWY